MESKVITETFRNQASSLETLDTNERSIATIQTLRMSLVMLKYSLNREDLHELFNLYDNELQYLLLEEDVENIVNYTDDNHELEEECCVKKEEFSDNEKEDSSWASRLSEAPKVRNIICVNTNKGKEVDIKDLFYYTEDRGIILGADFSKDQYDLLNSLMEKHVAVRDAKYFLDILEMYRDEDDVVLKSTNAFNFLFKHGCGDVLLDYLKKTN